MGIFSTIITAAANAIGAPQHANHSWVESSEGDTHTVRVNGHGGIRRDVEVTRIAEGGLSAPDGTSVPMYADVGGVTVDIASPAYAAWYRQHYG